MKVCGMMWILTLYKTGFLFFMGSTWDIRGKCNDIGQLKL